VGRPSVLAGPRRASPFEIQVRAGGPLGWPDSQLATTIRETSLDKKTHWHRRARRANTALCNKVLSRLIVNGPAPGWRKKAWWPNAQIAGLLKCQSRPEPRSIGVWRLRKSFPVLPQPNPRSSVNWMSSDSGPASPAPPSQWCLDAVRRLPGSKIQSKRGAGRAVPAAGRGLMRCP